MIGLIRRHLTLFLASVAVLVALSGGVEQASGRPNIDYVTNYLVAVFIFVLAVGVYFARKNRADHS